MPRFFQSIHIFIIFFVITGLSYAETEYKKVPKPCSFEFPLDFAPHEGFRTEWWYYTGNLDAEDGRELGFQFTIFRRQLLPNPMKISNTEPSPWRSIHLYMAHAAVSDFSFDEYFTGERTARGAAGLAGFSMDNGGARIYILDWKTSVSLNGHHIVADTSDFSYDLEMTPDKPPVFHGDGGWSNKGGPDNASCYYSFTDLNTKGTVTVKGKSLKVTGKSWMDHEFGTTFLEKGAVGWDWFSLRFDDQTEMMLFMIRKKDAENQKIFGTFIPAGHPSPGMAVNIEEGAYAMETIRTWKSPETGAVYPVERRIFGPGGKNAPALDIVVSARIDKQEMRTPESTNVAYWEGGVSVTGIKAGKKIMGKGYVEMTGYDDAFNVPM